MSNLHPHQSAADRPDLCNRVFQLKLAALLSLIRNGNLLGPMVSILHVIEFQKRGLPHAHIAIRVQGGGPSTAAEINEFVRATLPSTDKSNEKLTELVIQHMVHGPCGLERPAAPCMDQITKTCFKGFPKQYC